MPRTDGVVLSTFGLLIGTTFDPLESSNIWTLLLTWFASMFLTHIDLSLPFAVFNLRLSDNHPNGGAERHAPKMPVT